MIKNYVLDTNILLADAKNIYGFDDNTVIITGTTLQELDRKKDFGGEVGYNARECCRLLDGLRKQGSLIDGVLLPNGGTLKIEPDGVKQEYLPDGFFINTPDNKIISTCIHLTTEKHLKNVILVSNDISMRVSATACGVDVQSYLNDQIEESGYTGYTIKDVDPGFIDTLYEKGAMPFESEELLENEFITFRNGSQSVMTMFSNGKVEVVKSKQLFGNVKPMNMMQNYAMHALLLPPERVPLVILKGPAGTAKTFLSLAVALDGAMSHQNRNKALYRKVLISRPNAEAADPGFGYLPGDIQEKMTPLLSPYFDNLSELFMKNNPDEDPDQIQMQIDDLFASGAIEVCPLSYIRGRTISNSVIICDEAQNAKKELIRDVITRAGNGSKVIICGDIEQIDNPLLDARNNGLTYAIETMKGSRLAAFLEMPARASVRSPLASEAIRRMRPEEKTF